ncbi:MAG TPA: FkbM family methyltransferase [Cyclobacteriaceae bacterium]|nr:FkbM family methyltransferase [Cyclobacteriaceae bacterium]
MTQDQKHITVDVRGTELKLMTYTRSLELCARMNYETENLDFIDRIDKGKVLYDLGACEGRFSIYAAKRGIRVVSFEPESMNYSVLSQNLELNELDGNRVKAMNAGVGAANGKATMDIGQPWEGGHQKVVNHGEVRSDLNFNFVSKQEIRIISLDSFVEEGGPKPDYLKIDIDGSEMPFLAGAKKTLMSDQLNGIIFELNLRDSNFKTIHDLLNNCGFAEKERFQVPNEPDLYNIIFYKSVERKQ